MINPNEVRIGNWFMSARGEVPFQWQASDFGEIYNTQAKPIPLSPEILLKCGFKECDRGWQMDGPLSNTVCKDGDGYNIEDWEWGCILSKPIYFLHQLQNAIFVFTGEELTIEDLNRVVAK